MTDKKCETDVTDYITDLVLGSLHNAHLFSQALNLRAGIRLTGLQLLPWRLQLH